MLMAGGTAGVASWIFTVPIDVVKTRIQCDTVGKYSGAVDCFKKIYKSEGFPSFFRGLTSSLIRAFPTNAATFTVVTYIMRYIHLIAKTLDCISFARVVNISYATLLIICNFA